MNSDNRGQSRLSSSMFQDADIDDVIGLLNEASATPAKPLA
jgi:hypothetical protein